MPQLGTGDGTETVLLGCLVEEHLRLWKSDGRPECVRVLQPSELRAFLARGLAPRASLERGRYREVGRLDPDGVLLIGRQPFSVEVCEHEPGSAALWTAAAEVFQDAAAAAISRGEYLVVEPGGWEVSSEPFALAAATRMPGEWLLRVEAVPAPHAPSWPEPPAGHAGWGIAAPADSEALAALGILLAEAVAMWARSPLDVVLTFGKQPDGPWPSEDSSPAIESLLVDIRADFEELHASRQLTRARDLSARASAHFNHNTYPVFFTGDLRSRVVLVHPNPQQPENDAAEYEGELAYADFDEYLERHRRFGYYHWVLGDEHPTPDDYKQLRFLRPWGIIDVPDAETNKKQRAAVAHAFDQRLQLELIPYGSPKFPADALSPEVIEPHYQRLMRVITACPRDCVILCGAVFDRLFEAHIVERDDHRFRLPTAKGTSRVEYRFSNLVLDFDGVMVPVGLAPSFSGLGTPIGAYGHTCHDLYRRGRA